MEELLKHAIGWSEEMFLCSGEDTRHDSSLDQLLSAINIVEEVNRKYRKLPRNRFIKQNILLWSLFRFSRDGVLAWNNNMNRNNLNSAWLWIRHGFEVERDWLQTKNRNISVYQTTNLLKTRFLFLVCKRRKKGDKSEFVTKSVEIIVTIIFM